VMLSFWILVVRPSSRAVLITATATFRDTAVGVCKKVGG
jgi:hypothetical protein